MIVARSYLFPITYVEHAVHVTQFEHSYDTLGPLRPLQHHQWFGLP